MIRIARPGLSVGLSTKMAALSDQITGVAPADRQVLAKRLWRQGSTRRAVRTPVKEVLAAMAPGRQRCMYCGDSEGTNIDHFDPIARNPLRTFDWLNHLLACTHCNSNEKRDQFPVDAAGMPLLIDPTVEDPADHLFLSLSVGEYHPLSERGGRTIEVCGLNRPVLSQGRTQSLDVVTLAVFDWKRAYDAGDRELQVARVRTIKQQPFADVGQAMLRQALAPGAPILFAQSHDLVDLLRFPPLREALLF